MVMEIVDPQASGNDTRTARLQSPGQPGPSRIRGALPLRDVCGFHVGRMCGGGYGFLFRWYGRSDVERWRIGWSSR